MTWGAGTDILLGPEKGLLVKGGTPKSRSYGMSRRLPKEALQRKGTGWIWTHRHDLNALFENQKTKLSWPNPNSFQISPYLPVSSVARLSKRANFMLCPLFPASFSNVTPSCLSCHPSITNQFHHDTLTKWAFVVLILLSFSSVFTTERHSFLPEAPFALGFQDTHSSRYVPVHSLLLLRLLCQLPLLYPMWNVYFLALYLGFFFST